jgi:hypothetical protein
MYTIPNLSVITENYLPFCFELQRTEVISEIFTNLSMYSFLSEKLNAMEWSTGARYVKDMEFILLHKTLRVSLFFTVLISVKYKGRNVEIITDL